MEIQPRRDILELWRSAIDYSYRDGTWTWGGRFGRNSVSDAEQLLTILYPGYVIESLRFDSINETAEDVLACLHALGNVVDIPRRLVGFIGEYMRTYLVDGTPDFSGGSYFEPLEGQAADVAPAQRDLTVVDSYSMSLTLCLATRNFLQTYRRNVQIKRLTDEIDEVDRLCSQRLTAAMVGLLRSFTVNTFEPSDPAGQTMCMMANPTGMAPEIVVRDLIDELDEIRSSIRQEVTIGLGLDQIDDELENRGRLFELGWSWGVIDGAPKVDYTADIGTQPTGVAEARPYLYFTVAALDGIQDLFSPRTRRRGLLDVDQQRLARALQLRWDLTQQFWAKIATFRGGEKWPVENLPWTTTDGNESDYYSLLLSSIVIEDVGERHVGADIERTGLLLGELANRGRITSRPTTDDPAVAMHVPGVALRLVGSEKVAEGPQLLWAVPSFSALVLKRLLRVAELLDYTPARARTLNLADLIWKHLELRRVTASHGRGLWDEPTQVFTELPFAPYGRPSWHQTERIMEALVAAANLIQSKPAAPQALMESAALLLSEAERLFDQERLRGTDDTGEQMRQTFQVVGANLMRARELLIGAHPRPGTASVLAGDVLRKLDEIDSARQDTARMS
jgi:hypothetical protein